MGSGRDTLSFHTVGGTNPTQLLALTPQETLASVKAPNLCCFNSEMKKSEEITPAWTSSLHS